MIHGQEIIAEVQKPDHGPYPRSFLVYGRTHFWQASDYSMGESKGQQASPSSSGNGSAEQIPAGHVGGGLSVKERMALLRYYPPHLTHSDTKPP